MAHPDASLGKVIASTDSAAYTTAGGDRFTKGQCTWYCCGRAKEKKGVNLSALLPSPANGCDWYKKVVTNAHVTKRAASQGPVVDSIASFSHNTCGHVVYIEAIRDGYVYFTEYNWNQNMNGKLQKVAENKFATMRSNCTLNGYIVIR